MRRLSLLGLAMLAVVSERAHAGEVNVVSKVTARAEGSKTVITVHGSGTPSFTAYRLERPSRVVVDLAGSTLVSPAAEGGPFDVDTWAVGQIAAQQYADDHSRTARIMIGFKRPASYDVRAQGHDVVIIVTPDQAQPIDSSSSGDAARAKAEAARAEAERARAEAEQARKEAESAKLQAERARAAEQERLDSLKKARVEEERRAERQIEARRAAEEATARAEKARLEAEAARSRAESAKQELEQLIADRNAEHAKSSTVLQAEMGRLRREREREQTRLEALRSEADQLARSRAEEARRLPELQAQARRAQAARAAKLDEARLLAEKRAHATEATRETEERRLREQAERAEQLAREAQVARRTEKGDAAAIEAEKRAREAANRAAAELNRVEAVRGEARKLEEEARAARAEVERARVEMERLSGLQKLESARVEEARLEAQRLALQRAAEAERAAHQTALAFQERAKVEAAEREARRIAEERGKESVRFEQARKEALALADRRAAELAKLDQARAEAKRLTEQRTAELDALRGQRVAEEAKLEAARHETARLQSEVTRLAQAAQAARTASAKETEEMRAARDAVAKETAQMRAERERAERDAAQASAELKRADEEKRAALAGKQSAQALALREATRLKKELDGLERERRAAQMAVEDERRAARDSLAKGEARLSVELERLERERRAAESAALKKQAQQTAAAERAATLEAEVQRIAEERRAAQAALEAQRAALDAERAATQRDKSRMEKERTTLEVKLTEARTELARLETETRKRLAVVPTPARLAAAVRARVRDVRFADDADADRIIVELVGDPEYTVLREGSHTAILRIAGVELPRALERTLDARAFQGPVQSVSTYRDPEDAGAVRVVVALGDGAATPTLARDGAHLTWQFPRSQASRSYPPQRVGAFGQSVPLQLAAGGVTSMPAPGRGHRRVYTGRRIELDLKEADIHNVLRLLADLGQIDGRPVNIVASDEVKGTITIHMKDVPWDQALDVILRTKGLGMQREGNLIRVAPTGALEKELEAEVARAKAAVELRPIDTKLIQLSYANALQMLPRVQDILSSRGKASVDARTNMLIVSDVSGNIALAEDLVRNLDTQTPQVLIEARVVEARSTFLRDIGVQWGGNSLNSAATGNPTGIAFPSTVGVAGGATDSLGSTQGLQLGGAASPNYAVNMPAAVGTGSGGALGLTLGSVAGTLNINLRLSALENTGQVRIVSAPKITTLDNVEATIEQGVAIPISVVSAAGTNTVFVDAKLNLTVKPHVTAEGSVIMNVAITRNEPDFVNTGARGDPTILKKQARTEMLVRDGDTAVIGGIYTRNTGLSYAKVPWFADIPVIGWLFKNRRENDDRTELLIFITPRIVNRATARR